jgi:hypothetical protein
MWHLSPLVQQPRRCSRLAHARYVSIIDRAIARKKDLLDNAAAEVSRRRGELSADDLLDVAVEDDREIAVEDIAVLAKACDIPCEDLCLVSGSSEVLTVTP